jgi:hypothetical protein
MLGGGGGGAGFGGALFVASGALIVIENDIGFSGNSALGGASSEVGAEGAADGNDLFGPMRPAHRRH